MGLQSGVIEDSQLSTSSWSLNHEATEIRLGRGLGWIPSLEDDLYPWITVQFMRMAHIMGVILNGKVSDKMLQVSTDISGKYNGTQSTSTFPLNARCGRYHK